MITLDHGNNLPGLYIHIPFCRSKCSYCSFYSTTSLERIDDFLSGLLTEMNFYGPSFGRFDTLYIGGGTPSVLSIKHFSGILTHVHKTFHFTENPEITVEINPADMSFNVLKSLRSMGVNRISIGAQSFNDNILAFLGRRHTGSQARRTIVDAGRAGFENIGIDLMYGIPGQDIPLWAETLEEAISCEPEHLSCYQLTLEDDTPLGKRHRMGEFLHPDEDRQYDFFMRTSTVLEGAGYVHYEVSNFARNKNLFSRHNSKYWNHTPYLGLGPAAHSLAENRRWWNKGSLAEYLANIHAGKAPVATSETLSTEELRLEALFLGFRTKEGIHLKNFNTRFGCDLLEEKAETIKTLQNSGFIRIEDGYLRPTPSGLAVADSLSLI
jgi:oxygen-independent coproporphyrinogen-3 oxidase